MKKATLFVTAMLAVGMMSSLVAAADTEYTGFASSKGFEAHGDVAFATAVVDEEGNLKDLNIDEYYGIRSIGRIANNLEKASEEELAKVDEIADEDKVYSEDGKYVAYKYMMFDNKIFECEDAGENLFKEIGEGAEIEDLQAYLLENTDWWCNLLENPADSCAILKVAADDEEVVAEIDGVKLAKMGDIQSFYGELVKSAGYSKNFSAEGTTTAWEDSMKLLEEYIMNENGVSDELVEVANAETTEGFLDTVSGATFGYPSIYVNVAQAAIEDANAQIK